MRLEQIRRVGVAGAGTMGTGIAQLFAEAGFYVTWYNRSAAGIERGLSGVRRNQNILMESGTLTAEESRESRARLNTTLELSDLASVEFVAETIVEDMDAKIGLFRSLAEICPPDAVLTTNTSWLSISRLATAVSGPERFSGLHFLNPAHLIPLVEVIPGEATSDRTVELVMGMARRIGRRPIVVRKEVPGYVTVRLQAALVREAVHLVQEGVATSAEIDVAMKDGLGMRWALLGPLEIADLGGLDVFNIVTRNLNPHLSAAQGGLRLLETLVASGRLGVKSGAGFYDYAGDESGKVLDDRDRRLLKLLRIKSE
ncbi:MAG: 3-hydroxyacyl-CoA dehydrogenase family protein [Candidatus Aminicenantes bacterium]|nr:3-hydroxyacyl-CoA dehydrogenase family protein [Candidatus Aminicenantes bacterium]